MVSFPLNINCLDNWNWNCLDTKLGIKRVRGAPQNLLEDLLKPTHFTGQSCYSCRAFFRRTSPRPISSFRCRSGLNNCTINSGSKSCIPCRLTKCLQVSCKLNSKNWFIFCLLILGTIQHCDSLWLCWQNDLYESKGLFP